MPDKFIEYNQPYYHYLSGIINKVNVNAKIFNKN